MESLERFFTGDDIKLYTNVDGTMLKDRLKQQVIECNYSMSAIKKQCDGTYEEET